MAYPWSFKDLIVILGGAAGIFLVCISVITILLHPAEWLDKTVPPPTQMITLAAAEGISLIGGVYFGGLRQKQLTWKAIGLRTPTIRWFFSSAAISIVAIPVSGLITLTIMLLLNLPLENPQLDILLPDKITPFEMIGMLLFAGVIAPLGEEFLFRGVLYPLLRNKWGVFIGVFTTSLIFAIAHLNILIGINAFLLGILLAILFEYSRSLWISSFLHILNNTMRLAILYLFVRV